MEIVRADLPPIRSALREWHKIHGAKTTRGFQFVCLADEALGILTHHDPDTGVPWPCQGKKCRFDHVNNHPRFRAYMPAKLLPTDELIVVEMTEGAYRHITTHEQAATGLRGCQVWIRRKTTAQRAPVMADILRKVIEFLPPVFDPLPHMLRFWGLHEQKENAKELAEQQSRIGGTFIQGSVNMGGEDGEEGQPAIPTTPRKGSPQGQAISGQADSPNLDHMPHLPEVRNPVHPDPRSGLKHLMSEVRRAGLDRGEA